MNNTSKKSQIRLNLDVDTQYFYVNFKYIFQVNKHCVSDLKS